MSEAEAAAKPMSEQDVRSVLFRLASHGAALVAAGQTAEVLLSGKDDMRPQSAKQSAYMRAMLYNERELCDNLVSIAKVVRADVAPFECPPCKAPAKCGGQCVCWWCDVRLTFESKT